MSIVGRVGALLQSSLTELAGRVGEKTGIIRRERKFSASTLAQVVVLTLWRFSSPRWSDFADMAGTLGIQVTANGVKDRFGDSLVTFLHELLRSTVKQSFAADPLPVALLNRFNGVYVGDSTVISLSEEMAKQYPGCGGSHGAGAAAIKIQTRINVSRGEIDYLEFEAGRDCDVKSAMQHAPTPPGSLTMYDLGYFDIGVLAERTKQGVFWISRIQTGTKVSTDEPIPRTLPDVLQNHRGPEPLDLKVRVGADDEMPCRLLALRCPEEVANCRRQAVYDEYRRKGRMPSAARLEWCNWMILITNLPADQLTWKEAIVLYRTRWQIELLFKLWKSHGQIAKLDAKTPVHQMAFLYARLIAVVLQHAVLLATTGANIRRSFVKAARVIKHHLHNLATALKRQRPLTEFLEDLIIPLRSATIDKRTSKPSWFQLISNPELLDWGS